MENSAYASNALPPSTLVVLSQTANDALRIQRSRSGEDNGNFGFRVVDGYPSHLFHHQIFHHSGLAARSAFAPPPVKTFKLEEMLSPISVSVSPSPEDTSPSSSTPDEPVSRALESALLWREILVSQLGLSNLHNKKTETSSCPVCGITVRPGDLDSHFIQELEKLYKITSASRCRRSSDFTTNDESLENRWEAYLRIKSNRHCRMRLKSRKKKSDDVVCPICNESVYGSMQQLNSHVEICLRKHGSFSEQEEEEEEETVDVEGDAYDSYEWTSQNRIPPILLTGMGNQSAFHNKEETGDATTDKEDESSHFGQAQYSESESNQPNDSSQTRQPAPSDDRSSAADP